MTKTCFKCREVLPISKFYQHPDMADGHLGKCKSCTKADVRKNRLANLDEIRAYDRERAKLPHRKTHAAETLKKWRTEHPGRSAVQLRAGRKHRKAPDCCQMCGLPKRLERHHPDYDLPLLIVWLCKPCHYRADEVRRAREQMTAVETF